VRVVAGQRERAQGQGQFHHRGSSRGRREDGVTGAAPLALYLNADAQLPCSYQSLQMHKFTPVSDLALKFIRKNY